MAIKLIYTDTPLGAREDAKVTTTQAERFSDVAALPFGVNTGAVATCEPNAWGLSHKYKARGTQQFAMWSTYISNAEGNFDTVPSVVIEFTEQYTSTGFSFRFSPDANEYCTQIGIIWYQNDVKKESGVFYPNAPVYTAEKAVEAFDKVEIFFGATNLPNRRLKLEQLAIGVVREFDGKELTGASFVHEIDLISNSVPANVLDASFHNNGEAEFIFQRKQPVEAYNDNDLIGVYYIETGERTSAQNYNISCHDAIGVLELDTYKGGLWLTDTPIETIIDDVIGGAFVVEIDEALQGATLRGMIDEDITKREALQKIAFALGACVDTTGTANIKLFKPSIIEGTEISEKETYTGGSVSTADMVTEVSVISYEISEGEADEDEETIEFGRKSYRCVVTEKTAVNPNIAAGTLPNKVEFSGCYLCNNSNATARAEEILAYYMRRNTYTAKHIVRGQNLGERATVHLPWGDVKNANIKKMSISVTGLTVSDTEFLLD